MEAYVRSETRGGITHIEFFHPQSNSLPISILNQLAQEIFSAGTHTATAVIVLKSAGDGAFCAGGNFEELTAIGSKEDGQVFFSGFAKLINAMRKCPKIIIGRIHGKCAGGGVGIAAACDYAIATDGADIKLSELALGIGPFVVGPAVERKIGVSAFSQLAIDAKGWRNAEWAKLRGLYAELHHDVKAMDEAIEKLALTLSHSHPEAMAHLKKIFWQGTEDWDELLKDRAAISGQLVLSRYTREAIANFKTKK